MLILFHQIGRTDNAVVASKVKTDLKFYVKTDLEGEKKTENSVKKHKKKSSKVWDPNYVNWRTDCQVKLDNYVKRKVPFE